MIRLSGLVLIALLFFMNGCTNSAENKNEEIPDSVAADDKEVVMPALHKDFPELHRIFSGDSLYSSGNFEGGETQMPDTIPSISINEQQLAPYLPYLIYNSNDSLAIDFVSYNFVFGKKGGKTVLQTGGPDSEIAIIDLRNKTRKRIFFTGASGTILDARWEDENTIVFVTATEGPDGLITPSILRYHANTGVYEMYTYEGAISADISNYTEQQLNTTVRTSHAS